MNQTTIEEFREYLTLRNYSKGTIAGYIRTIGDLSKLPDKPDPHLMLEFVDNAIRIKKKKLSRSNFLTARASLNAFFHMRTGILIKDFRRQCIPPDSYTPLMEQYINYCSVFLQLTDTVIKASVREAKRFLSLTHQDPKRTDWSDVTADDIVAYLKKERSNLSLSSLGVTVTAIRRFFYFLEHNECKIHTSILHLPLSALNWSKNRSLPVVLTEEQLHRLTSIEFEDTLIGLRDRAILLCFTELGLRCSEVSCLQFEDIKWNNGTILIRNTKTRSQRELPLSEKLGKALEDYVIASKMSISGSFLFFNSQRHNSDPASTDTIRSVIRRLFQKSEITGLHLGTHALRRTVGSKYYNAGNNLKIVADFLGHSSIASTTAYVRIDVESLREVASSWPGRDLT